MSTMPVWRVLRKGLGMKILSSSIGAVSSIILYTVYLFTELFIVRLFHDYSFHSMKFFLVTEVVSDTFSKVSHLYSSSSQK
jgi:hypothetical protein